MLTHLWPCSEIENGDEGGSALVTVCIVQAAPNGVTVPEALTSVDAFYHLRQSQSDWMLLSTTCAKPGEQNCYSLDRLDVMGTNVPVSSGQTSIPWPL
jgi:hypothetical protein